MKRALAITGMILAAAGALALYGAMEAASRVARAMGR